MIKPHIAIFLLLITWGCHSAEEKNKVETQKEISLESPVEDIPKPEPATPPKPKVQKVDYSTYPDSALVNLIMYNNNFDLDIKYATTDNFTKTPLYDCEQCLLRKVVADSLISLNNYLHTLGYRLKLFDCYRPLSVQIKMWEKVPDPRYVADPAKGSMHNRGNAVDVSLVEIATGQELEMGSPYDHFGQISHHAYQELPKEVLSRRVFLKVTMEMFGFKSITSEWWHYSFRDKVYHIMDQPFECE
ncbi:M15 family metallopeptidase [Flexithrix dorotheae]|uniref:M15 family metallopeptidase n=1 Tax=Flexithrix dorotheae TaxID=70993 RepID=UPI000376D371|nr:M15 family metallopeptidase [Flexithrix dorotheae]